MAEYLIQDTTLKDIANAIREKTGKIAYMETKNMATEISSIDVRKTISGTTGAFTASSGTMTVEHGMGTTPNMIIVVPEMQVTASHTGIIYSIGFCEALFSELDRDDILRTSYQNSNLGFRSTMVYTGFEQIRDPNSVGANTWHIHSVNDTTFTLGDFFYPLLSGGTYRFFAFAGLI